MDSFGISAPDPIGYAKFGFTVENVVATARKVLG
jgi:transketolase